MNGDVVAGTLYSILMLVLVGGALAARRVPLGQTLKMALAWAAIFGIGFITLSFRHDLSDLFGSRVLGRAIIEGSTVRVPMADDGHFWIDMTINGRPARLMVDSGASITTLSQATAAAAGVDVDAGSTALVQTANGTLQVGRARVRSIGVGAISIEDLPVHIAPGGDFNVVGMNFLTRLSRWSVEGRCLILTG